ncbi:MAG: B12-binding domain-containing radical SAM protein [Desulfobacterota bacterium]|nr:B12-binding domain-containing radical SAM protein [Thermodesulfobacteriota bacterium]
MRIALIATPYPLEEAPSPPLGLAYAAAACEAAGATVRIFDFIVSKYSADKLEAILDSFRPDVVGAGSVTMNQRQAERIIKDAKRIMPSVITLMGGPHVSFDIEGTFRSCPELDIIVKGEGEQTLQELIPALEDRGAWHGIRGIAFRSDRDIVVTGPRELIHDLDSLPLPARHLLPVSRYLALGYPVSIITSRGCPNKCIFCLGRRMVGFKGRFRNPGLVVDEIEHILSLGFTRINVADDLFTANKARVRELCDEIKRRGVKFGWSAFARVNTVDLETLKIMRETGCDCVSFGIESGNPEMLKRIRKGITLEQARNAVTWCKEADIMPHASFMVGLPGETKETLHQTQAFADELSIAYGYHFFSPFPGTTVREELEAYDIKILTDDWSRYDANSPVVQTSGLSPEDMTAFVAVYDEFNAQIWEETERNVRMGTCTDREYLLVEGNRKLKLVYRVLSEDLIEESTCPKQDGSDPVELLSASVARRTSTDPVFTHKVLKDFSDAGYLRYTLRDGQYHYYWTHNKAIDTLPVSS